MPIDDIIIRDTFTFSHFHTLSQAHKLSLKELSPSNWLGLVSLNWIASVRKALDGDAVLIMPDRWRETFQEAEMGENACMKKSRQKQN
jgi:hypothetical protein